MKNQSKIQEVLSRGVEKIYPSREALEKALVSGKKIKLYCGYDPTAPSLHIGHAITLRKLAQFQKLGHEAIMLIGDFTAMIGDPTDKTAARKQLTRKQVLDNGKNYKKQASRILNFSGKNPAKILYNSQWQDKLTSNKIIELAANFTVGQMIVRDMFQQRIKKNKPIFLHEFLYPLFQAYDSAAMDVDLEVGGNDQTFNMLCGRDLMKALKNKEKFVLTAKLLVDPTGKKMGKTEGNIVNLDEKPKEMFGKIMSWPDELIILGLELCSDVPMEEIKRIEQEIKENKINPRDAKIRLAEEIVSVHHGKERAKKAKEEFERVFKNKEKPSEMPEIKLKADDYNILDLLVKTKLAPSKGGAKRLVEQGGVKIDGKTINDWKKKIELKNRMVIQTGKRKFIEIIP